MTKIKSSEPQSDPAGRPVTEEAILKVAKEVVVKFIEVGRLSPANFNETFREIHQSIREAVRPKQS